ncbi:DEAD-domain-containing protein [Panus rudis PR-1116 ss-1]|nr:DEAD-domain-containing protein [Panus rudis PR-1116 ss-1]
MRYPYTAVEPISSEHKSDKKEKKKRKREQVDEGEPSATVDEASEEGKKKKKKRKSEGETETPAGQTSSFSSSKKEKKDKKDKKSKSKAEPSTSLEPSSTSTPARAPAPVTAPSTSSGGSPSQDEITEFLTKNEITIHSDKPLTPILSFSQLTIPDDLRSALSGFKEPTPIQACAWPPLLEGRDVVGIAETGSGKTLAFGLPALARLISTKYTHTKPVALVLAPTRELAIQTHDTLSALGEPFGIRSVALFGGVDKNGQIQLLKNSSGKKGGKGKSKNVSGNEPVTRIIVGTPGRILDLINDGVCDLSEVHYLVLDEADRMLDKGFENDIRSIIGHTVQGEGRQTLMFSATWPEAVRRLAATFQRNPVRVTVGSDDLTANSRVEQELEVFDDARSKDQRLLNHLTRLLPKKSASKSGADAVRVLVFALYKKEAARVEETLRRRGYNVTGLHGDMSQHARMEALQKFKDGVAQVMVATDVAARGLDIPNVAAVINYTFPLTIEDYIHRIGRTGRGGKTGKSITFFTGDAHERALAGELARVLRESGFESQCDELKERFPMTIKKKTHGAYGAFFRDDIPPTKGPTKITFD